MLANLENSAVVTGTGKGQSQRKAMPKNVQTPLHLGSICMLVKLCSTSFKLGFSSMWTENFQMYKLGLEKAEEPEIKLPTFTGSWRRQQNFRKASSSLTMLKPLIVWITTNCEKFLKRWEYQTTLSVSWETCMWVKKQQLELDMEQTDWFQIWKGVWQGCILLPGLFNFYAEYITWNASGQSTSWNQDCQNYWQPQIHRWNHSSDRNWRRTKELLDEGEKRQWNSWLESHHSKK